MDNSKNATTISIATGTIVKTILLLILFYILYILKDLILVILTAIVIASSVEPATKWFARRHIPRLPAVIIVYLIVATLIFSLFYFLVPPLLDETAIFLQSLPTYVDRLEIWNPLSQGSDSVVKGITGSFSIREIVSELTVFLESFSGNVLSALTAVFGGVLSFIVIAVLSFYLSVQEDGVGKFLRIITPVRYRKYVTALWLRSQVKIGLWMQGQLLLGIIVGILIFLGLTILGVENALLLAFLGAVLELLPLFGPVLSAIPAIIVGLLGGGVTLALLVLGLYLIIQQFENHLIYPVVVKKVVGVPPTLVIIALFAGAKLAGFLGLILSVPVVAIIIEYLNDIQKDSVMIDDDFLK
ncbi:MAG: AI-2E family transporter [bacterium]|nr:AI-2E family transporter [bacterium]